MIRVGIGTWLAALPVSAVTLYGPVPADAQSPPFPPGAVVERVTALSDSTQTYAVYLPAAYDPARTWPVVFLMDPRGRALIPLERVRAAADRLGYVVLSSYNTLSDGALDPNVDALQAMIDDVQLRFSPDLSRLYLVGFSGTARAAWDFGYRLAGHVAGVIGFGAGFHRQFLISAIADEFGTPFVFYGGAGTGDFNYEELLDLDDALDEIGVRHRIVFYDGPHSWPEADVFADALDWMELHAMRTGARERNDPWLDSTLAIRSARARALEADASLYEAHRMYQAIVEDFADMRDVSGAREQADRLARDRTVRRTGDHIRRLAERSAQFRESFDDFREEVSRDERPFDLNRAMKRLDLDEITERAADTADTYTALANQRMLEHAYVMASFYDPRTYFSRGEPRRALAMLRLAQRIKPNTPRVCYGLARAHALLDQTTDALAALQCAVDAGVVTAATIEDDPHLASLRDLPEYRDLLTRMRQPR